MRAPDQIKSLNDLPRTGWVRRGISEPETVGEHTVECIAILHALADELGDDFDIEHTVEMLAVHDWPESNVLVGDITIHCGVSAEEKFLREKHAMIELCSQLKNGDRLLQLWLEFEEQATVEARIARQIDKFQVVYKAVQYHVEQGLDPSDFLANDAPMVVHPVLVTFVERLRSAFLAKE